MTLDEELTFLVNQEKQLLAIIEKRKYVQQLQDYVATGAPLSFSQMKSAKKNKRHAIAVICETYLSVHEKARTCDLVAHIKELDPTILENRREPVVAVSQALGERKEHFKPNRTIGWTLIKNEQKK